MTDWFVYVLVSGSTSATYVGVTVDVDRRLAEHNGERPGGARRTRAGRPWEVARVHGPYTSRAEAQQVEAEIKKLRGKRRLQWS